MSFFLKKKKGMCQNICAYKLNEYSNQISQKFGFFFPLCVQCLPQRLGLQGHLKCKVELRLIFRGLFNFKTAPNIPAFLPLSGGPVSPKW